MKPSFTKIFFFCLLLLSSISFAQKNNISLIRGTTAYPSWNVTGDYSAYDTIIFKANLGGGDYLQKLVSQSYSSPTTTLRCTLYVNDTQDLSAGDYHFNVYAFGADTVVLVAGYMKLTKNVDLAPVPLTFPRFTIAALDDGSGQTDIAIWDTTQSKWSVISRDSLASLLNVAVVSDLATLETRFETDSGKVRFDISDSLAQNKVTEAYNLFSVTKQYPIAEDVILFRQKEGVRIDSVLIVVTGSTPSLNFNLLHGTLASPDSLFSAYQTADVTTGETFTTFNSDTLLVNEWVQISFNTISGVSSVTAIFYWTPLTASTYVPVRTSPSEYVDSYNQDNHLIDFFYGGRNVYDYNDSTALGTGQHAGFLDLQTGYQIDTTFINSKFYDAFTIKTVGDTAIPKFVSPVTRNNILTFAGDYYASATENANAVIGFWVNRTELNGNGIIYCDPSGGQHVISGANLAIKGYTSNYFGTEYLTVTEVDGDYSHVTYYAYDALNVGKVYLALSIYNSDADTVASFTIYNPTLIYNKNIDPYHRYKSLAETKDPRFIGKKILYIGDSQYNEGQFHSGLAKLTGAEILDAHDGGYAMYYRTDGTSWFYNWTNRQDVLEWTDIDYYILPISSNDIGGGNLRETAIDSVEYFYPVYGDHVDTVTAKLSRFSALSENDKASIFGFQQTYSAYLKQIINNNLDARIIICSVPIGAQGSDMEGTDSLDINGNGVWVSGFTPDSARANYQADLEQKRLETIYVKERYHTYFADLFNEVGLTWENFNRFSADGVHWNLQSGEIKRRIAYAVYQELLKVK